MRSRAETKANKTQRIATVRIPSVINETEVVANACGPSECVCESGRQEVSVKSGVVDFC